MKEKIIQLRKRIPIGVLEAKTLLQTTNFNISAAEKEWKKKQVLILCQIILITEKEAISLLEESNFESNKALSIYKNRSTTDVQKIIESSSKADEVLARFWNYVHYQLEDDHKDFNWITHKGFKSLPQIVSIVLIPWQWHVYYYHEQTSVEQSITDDVIEILENQLEMVAYANTLKNLKHITETFNTNHPFSRENFEQYFEARNHFTSSPTYEKLDQQIIANKALVLEKCYRFLVANSEAINQAVEYLKYE